jgi:hypothetical protein
MIKILNDTCVRLDLAKDHQGQSIVGVLEELVRQKQVSIVLLELSSLSLTAITLALPNRAVAACPLC